MNNSLFYLVLNFVDEGLGRFKSGNIVSRDDDRGIL